MLTKRGKSMRNPNNQGYDPDQHPSSLQLQGYLRCVLSGSGQPEDLVESHLQTCGACRQRLQEEIEAQAIREAVRHDAVPQAPDLALRAKQGRRFGPIIMFPSAIAAVLALAVGFVSWVTHTQRGLNVSEQVCWAPEKSRVSGEPNTVRESDSPGGQAPVRSKVVSGATQVSSPRTEPTHAPKSNSPQNFPLIHKVESNDTLTGLAVHYYNDYSQWVAIYNANRVIQFAGRAIELNEAGTNLNVGMELSIPEPSSRVTGSALASPYSVAHR